MDITLNQFTEILEKVQKFLQEIPRQEKTDELLALQKQSSEPGFWDQADAQKKMQRVSFLQEELTKYQNLETSAADIQAYLDLDADDQQAFVSETTTKYWQLIKDFKELELQTYLTGKYDQSPAIVSIHPGQGGTEAMDWAEMVARMYQRYFERKNWKFSLISEVRGEDAGIKEMVFEVRASNVYGFLKNLE